VQSDGSALKVSRLLLMAAGRTGCGPSSAVVNQSECRVVLLARASRKDWKAQTGNHTFRCFRKTYLRNYSECPAGPVQILDGSFGEKYERPLRQDHRKEWYSAEKWAVRCGFRIRVAISCKLHTIRNCSCSRQGGDLQELAAVCSPASHERHLCGHDRHEKHISVQRQTRHV
jgi:hypothetical protein